MSSSINASTAGAGGLITTADSSGVLNLQSGGTTVASIPNTTTFNFPALGTRITGDMSNATLSNRVLFQTSTTNGNTLVGALPNGTSSIASFAAFNNADPTNAGYVQIRVDSSSANINSAFSGTGTNIPMTFGIGGVNQMQIATDGTITGTKGNLQLISGTAVASTSGTSIDFTGIPSWAKRVTVMFQGVSTSGTSVVQIQLGAGSVTTSGYLGTSSAYAGGSTGSAANLTTGFGVGNFNSASNVRHGALILNNISGNIWSCNGVIALSDGAGAGTSAGTISLGGTLDRVRITTINGTDTFDAGSINIMYE